MVKRLSIGLLALMLIVASAISAVVPADAVQESSMLQVELPRVAGESLPPEEAPPETTGPPQDTGSLEESADNADSTPPTVVRTFPEDAAVSGGIKAAADTVIVVVFSEIMDQAAVENAFSVSEVLNLEAEAAFGPPLEGTFSWKPQDLVNLPPLPETASSGEVNHRQLLEKFVQEMHIQEAVEGTVLIFTPKAPLSAGTSYTVRLIASAADLAGNRLNEDYPFSFTTLAAEAASPLPPESETGVPSETVVPGETEITAPPEVTLPPEEPITPSETSAPEETQVPEESVAPEETIAPETIPEETAAPEVTVTPESTTPPSLSATPAPESVTPSPVSPPLVESSQPSNGDTNVAVDSSIAIVFSRPMDRSSVEDAFKIDPDTKGSWSWDEAGTVATFYPEVALAEDTAYTITLGSGARDLEGNPLDIDIIIVFTTVPASVPESPPPEATVVPSETPTSSPPTVPEETLIPPEDTAVPGETAVPLETAAPVVPLAPAETIIPTTEEANTPTPELTPTPTEIPSSSETVVPSEISTPGPSETAVSPATTAPSDTIVTPSPSESATLFEDITAPAVISTIPADNTPAWPVHYGISIQFNRAMDQASTQESFSINPNVKGTFSWVNFDSVLTFTPDGPLNTRTTYEVTINTTAKDTSGKFLQEVYRFIFTTGGDTQVVGSSPADGTVDVPVDSVIDITFSEAMDSDSAQSAFSILPPVKGSFKWDSAGRVMTFDPDTDLAPLTEYTVIVNPLASDRNDYMLMRAYRFSFSTAQIKPDLPSVVSTVPYSGALDVSLDSNITVVFSKSVDRTTAQNAFSITPVVKGTFRWNDASTEMTFGPDANLAELTTYQVSLSTAAQDTAGNSLAGVYKFFFTTIGVPGPSVYRTEPAANSTSVRVDIGIVIYFDRAMNQVITQGAFSIAPNINGAFRWSADGMVMTFDPADDLAADTSYRVIVSTAARDVDGKALVQACDISFTTGRGTDIQPPAVVSTVPADGAVNVSENTTISLTFSEPMDKASTERAFLICPSIRGTFSWRSNDKEMVFTPDSALAGGITYQVTLLNSARDLNCNPLLNSLRFAFAIPPPVISPQIICTIPDNGAASVAVNTVIGLIFNVPVDRASVEKAFSLNPGVRGAFCWRNNDTEMVFRPYSDLASGTTYNVTVSRSAKDKNGKALDHAYSFSFTTAQVVQPPPVILRTVPFDGQRCVPVSTNIVVVFSESMDPDSVRRASCMRPFRNGTFSWDPTGRIMTYNPDGDLNFGTTYEICINGSARSAGGIAMGTTCRFYFVTRTPAVVLPSVDTRWATDVCSYTANVNGYLGSLGNLSEVQVCFEWGTSSSCYTYRTVPQIMNSRGAFTYYLSSLSPGTRYYYRAIALDIRGRVLDRGAEKTFTTPRPPPPLTTQPTPTTTAPPGPKPTPTPTPTVKAPDVLWEKTFGQEKREGGNCILQIADGSFVVSGTVYPGINDVYSAWLLELDTNGNSLWSKVLPGGPGNCIVQTYDSGFLLGGSYYLDDEDHYATRLFRTDKNGKLKWSREIQATDSDMCNSFIRVKEEGYLLVGSCGYDSSENGDLLIVMVDNNGEVLWKQVYGEKNSLEIGYSVVPDTDGGYLVVGEYYSEAKGNQVWLIKIDKDGKKLWDKYYIDGVGRCIIAAADAGYLISGNSDDSALLIRIDAEGNEQWRQTYEDAEGKTLIRTADGGYALAGGKYLIKTDKQGKKQWQKAFAGAVCESLVQASDGGYVITGMKKQNLWVVKVGGKLVPTPKSSLTPTPSPSTPKPLQTTIHPPSTSQSPSTTSAPPASSPLTLEKEPGISINTANFITEADVVVDSNHLFLENVELKTKDKKAVLTIAGETKVSDSFGKVPKAFTVNVLVLESSASSEEKVILGYEFGPADATFEPSITLSLQYDPAALPPGTRETGLTLAGWENNTWKVLKSEIDTAAKVVSAKIARFGKYALLAVHTSGQTTPTALSQGFASPDSTGLALNTASGLPLRWIGAGLLAAVGCGIGVIYAQRRKIIKK